MRYVTPKLFALFFMQAAIAFSQTSGTSGAGFTLTLSKEPPDVRFPEGTQTLVVRLTNTSDTWIREDACEAGGALYKLRILYNGVPQPEPKWIRKRRKTAEAGEAKGGRCSGSNPGRRISLGQSWEDFLRYEAKKPGTYEFTVELKLPQAGLSSPVTVRSNTLTVAVPPAEGQPSSQ
jgi:hypothetical protein